MAGRLDPLKMELLGAVDEDEEAEGQDRSPKKPEDLLAMVKKLQKEGSLEPQIEDLINRIHELQQAKKQASEELGEARTLWEALHRELDSLNGEKVHLEEVLSKKQETLRILQLYCQEKESEVHRKHMLQDCMEQISAHHSQIPERSKQRRPGCTAEQLEELMGPHKDLWEFHMLEQRLVREIRTLESSKVQLLTEEMLVQAKLEEVGRRLPSPPEVVGDPPVNGRPLLRGQEATAVGLKGALDQLEGQVPAVAQSAPEREAGGEGDVGSGGTGRAGGVSPEASEKRGLWGDQRPAELPPPPR